MLIFLHSRSCPLTTAVYQVMCVGPSANWYVPKQVLKAVYLLESDAMGSWKNPAISLYR